MIIAVKAGQPMPPLPPGEIIRARPSTGGLGNLAREAGLLGRPVAEGAVVRRLPPAKTEHAG